MSHPAPTTFVACAVVALLAILTTTAPKPARAEMGTAETAAEAEAQPAPAVVYSPAFLDVGEDSPFAGDIRSLVAAGLTHGCDGEGRLYCPDGQVTRGQMAAFLGRALQLEPGRAKFSDTSRSVFATDIAALAEAGITRGCDPPDNTLFCPEEPITRGQMAAFLTRALNLPAGGATFTDTSGHVFVADSAALAEGGITRGCNPPDNTLFCPDEVVTRGQMAAFLVRGVGLAPIPAVPPGVTFERSELVNGKNLTEVGVCPGGGAVTVRNAAWGSVIGEVTAQAEPVEVTVTGGRYNQAGDVWAVPAADSCFQLRATWQLGPPPFFLPVGGYAITSPFGMRAHPIRGGRRLHAGVDFAVPAGTPVNAAAAGTVTAAGRSDGGYGKSVVISHRDGYTTRYAHLSEIAVTVGDELATAAQMGESGCTGSCTGPHLHFELRRDGEALDPLQYLRSPDSGPVTTR